MCLPILQSFFMAFGPGNQGALAALFDHLSKVASVTLVRSREFALDKAQVKRLWKLCGGKSAPGTTPSVWVRVSPRWCRPV